MLVRKRVMFGPAVIGAEIELSANIEEENAEEEKTTYSLIFQVWNRNKKGNGSFMHHIGEA